MPEIEKYILTDEETAALNAAVFATVMQMIDDPQDVMAFEVASLLQSGLKKILKLREELKSGVEDARKRGMYA